MIQFSKNGQFAEEIINDFSGGMTQNIRTQDGKFARVIQHFDILSAANRMKQNPTLEDDDTGGAVLVNVCKYLSANSMIYALGRVSGQGYPKVFQKNPPTGSWSASSNGASGAGVATNNETLFIEYKDILYGANYISSGDTRIWGYDYSGSGTFTETACDLGSFGPTTDLSTATIPVVGVVHSKDDILYIGYDHYIIKKNAGTVSANWSTALTLPTNVVITSICEYGNSLAIAVKPKYAGGKSGVYIWDRDATLVTLSEKINWGDETLQLIEEIGGYLVGISETGSATSSAISSQLIFKYYAGGLIGARTLPNLKLLLKSNSVLFAGRQKANDRLYFMMTAKLDDSAGGSQYDGVWSVGMSTNGPFALSLEYHANNGAAITSCSPKGFYLYGDWMHIAYTDNSIYKAVRTRSSGFYGSALCVYETLVKNAGDSTKKKKLLGISISFEPLVTLNQVTLKYKADSDSSWTTIYTHSTLNSIFHSAINIESTNVTLPEFNEIQFQITGDATSAQAGSPVAITSLSYKAEFIDSKLY